jgi:hypothetical protein
MSQMTHYQCECATDEQSAIAVLEASINEIRKRGYIVGEQRVIRQANEQFGLHFESDATYEQIQHALGWKVFNPPTLSPGTIRQLAEQWTELCKSKYDTTPSDCMERLNRIISILFSNSSTRQVGYYCSLMTKYLEGDAQDNWLDFLDRG